MRNLINIITETANSSLDGFFRTVAEHFESQGQYFYDGACLDFAQAMHNVLTKQGIESELGFVMRGALEDEIDDEDVLSHVVVSINGDTYDSQGSGAFEQWEEDYNYNQRSNGDDEAEFWYDAPDGAIDAKAAALGVSSNQSLRQAIETYALSIYGA